MTIRLGSRGGEISDLRIASGFGHQILIYSDLLMWEIIATHGSVWLMIEVHWPGVMETALFAPGRSACDIEDELYGRPE